MTLDSYSQLELMQARVKSVPNNWLFSYVGKVFDIKNTFRKPISDEIRQKNPGQYPYYGPTKIQGFIDTYEQDGQFALIGEDGDHFLKFRNLPMTQIIEGKCTVNNHAHIVAGTKHATREWFYYYFMHRDIFSFLTRQGAGRVKLNKAALEKIPLLVPPLPEQKKISEILSIWDQAIKATEQLLTNSQQQKKALMQQLLTGKKRLLNENGEVFSGVWVYGHLKDIAKIQKGRALSSKNIVNGQYPVIAGGKTSPYCHNAFTHENAITVSASGAYAGFAAYHSCKIWASDCSVVSAKNTSDTIFIFYLLQSQQNKIYSLQSGGAQPHIYSKDLEVLKVEIPALEEQQKIAAVLTAADNEIDALKQKLEHLKQEKKSLMQQLLTGKRRVKV